MLLSTITLVEARLLTVALIILIIVLRVCSTVLLMLIVVLPILLILSIASLLLILLPWLKRLGTRLESACIWSEAGGTAGLGVDV